MREKEKRRGKQFPKFDFLNLMTRDIYMRKSFGLTRLIGFITRSTLEPSSYLNTTLYFQILLGFVVRLFLNYF